MQQLKFIWERIKEKKLSHLIILIVLALIWLPTLTSEDLITIPFLITLLGFKVYLTITLIIVSLILIFFNGKFKAVKSLMKKPKESETRKICKKLYKTEKAINKCIKNNIKK